MNFKTAFIALALMGFGAATIVGCGGTACDDLSDTITSCSDYKAPADGTSDGETAECTDAAAKQSQCLLDSGVDLCKAFFHAGDLTADEIKSLGACSGS